MAHPDLEGVSSTQACSPELTQLFMYEPFRSSGICSDDTDRCGVFFLCALQRVTHKTTSHPCQAAQRCIEVDAGQPPK
eukprot:13448210-Heterocapsa_arctica.AAC.1